jgi:hypothetical protein
MTNTLIYVQAKGLTFEPIPYCGDRPGTEDITLIKRGSKRVNPHVDTEWNGKHLRPYF